MKKQQTSIDKPNAAEMSTWLDIHSCASYLVAVKNLASILNIAVKCIVPF